MKLCLHCEERFEALDWRCPSCGWIPEARHGHLSFASNLDAGNDGFSADYFENLAKVEGGSFWFQGRNRLLLWALQRYFPDAVDLLEVGCGTGFVLEGSSVNFRK